MLIIARMMKDKFRNRRVENILNFLERATNIKDDVERVTKRYYPIALAMNQSLKCDETSSELEGRIEDSMKYFVERTLV